MNNTREWLETKREFRYSLMRLVRSFGQIIFVVSLCVLCVGTGLFLLSLPDSLFLLTGGNPQYAPPREVGMRMHPFVATLAAGGIAGFGLFLLALAQAMTKPYEFNSDMPTTFIRECRACHEPLQKKWIIHRCVHCGKILPLGPVAYIVRLFGGTVTLFNWFVTLTLIGFLMVR